MQRDRHTDVVKKIRTQTANEHLIIMINYCIIYVEIHAWCTSFSGIKVVYVDFGTNGDDDDGNDNDADDDARKGDGAFSNWQSWDEIHIFSF